MFTVQYTTAPYCTVVCLGNVASLSGVGLQSVDTERLLSPLRKLTNNC